MQFFGKNTGTEYWYFSFFLVLILIMFSVFFMLNTDIDTSVFKICTGYWILVLLFCTGHFSALGIPGTVGDWPQKPCKETKSLCTHGLFWYQLDFQLHCDTLLQRIYKMTLTLRPIGMKLRFNPHFFVITYKVW